MGLYTSITDHTHSHHTHTHTYILHLHYIYAFSRRFYPKRLTLHSSYSFTFYQLLLSLGNEPMILALLAPCSTIWATGKLDTIHARTHTQSLLISIFFFQVFINFYSLKNIYSGVLYVFHLIFRSRVHFLDSLHDLLVWIVKELLKQFIYHLYIWNVHLLS